MTFYFLQYFFSEVEEESKQSWFKILNKGEKISVSHLLLQLSLLLQITFLPERTTVTVKRRKIQPQLEGSSNS